MVYYPWIRKLSAWLCILILVGSHGLTARAMVYTPPADQAEPSVSKKYTAELGPCTIGEGEIISYTTVASRFAGGTLPEGMYAGELTVNITGQVVIESGGCLEIGTLSIGGEDEASPLIQGILSESGLIVVKAGGRLSLKGVTLDTQGGGFLIVQEPGGSISIAASQLDSSLIQWAPAFVNNLNDTPDDLWLAEGTVLSEEQLPSSIQTNIQSQGTEDRRDVAVLWDMSGYDGRTAGEWTLTGQFLDESGEPLASAQPLTLMVHWYETQEIIVTDVTWRGENACSADFAVLELPEYTDVWGEISSDDGKTWSRWSEFDVTEGDDGILCLFYELENTPHLYRICAEYDGYDTYEFWTSDAFLLPDGDGEDQGGNRGGSITPDQPDRVPQPEIPQDSEQTEPNVPDSPQDSETEVTPWLPQLPVFFPNLWFPFFPVDVPAFGNTYIPGNPSGTEQEIPAEAAGENQQEEGELLPEESSPARETENSPEESSGKENSVSENTDGVISNYLTAHMTADQNDIQEGSNSVETPNDTDITENLLSDEDSGSPSEDSSEKVPDSIPDSDSDSAASAPQEAKQLGSDAPASISAAGQAALAVAGIGVCVIVGLAVAGVGPFRRRKDNRNN